MKAATLALLLAAAILAVGLACSDDVEPELTLEEYFAKMQTILLDSFDASETIKEEWDETRVAARPLTDGQRLEYDLAENLALLTASNATIDKMRAIEPPTEVVAAHGAYVDAIVDGNELGEAFLTSAEYERFFLERPQINDGMSREEVAAWEVQVEAFDEDFFPTELTSARERWLNTCTELLEIAEANGIDAQACGILSR